MTGMEGSWWNVMSKITVKMKVKLEKIDLDDKGVREMLEDKGIGYELNRQSWSIADEAGHAYVTKAKPFAGRQNAMVVQKQTEEDMEQNTLLKAVHFTND